MRWVSLRSTYPTKPQSTKRQSSNYQKQIGVAGLLAGGGDHRVRLAAMMRLVIEEMRDQEAARQAQVLLRRLAEPGQVAGEPCVVDAFRPGRDPGIGLDPETAQLGKILDHAGAVLHGNGRPG